MQIFFLFEADIQKNRFFFKWFFFFSAKFHDLLLKKVFTANLKKIEETLHISSVLTTHFK